MIRGLLLCAVGALVLVCTAAAHPFSGLLVYADQSQHGGGGAYRLLLAGEGGGYSKTLVTAPQGSGISGPAWSPDGRRLVFSMRGLWIVSASGSKPMRLTVGEDIGSEWSPDGRWIAYIQNAEQTPVYVVRPDGSDVHAVTEPGRFVGIDWLDAHTLLLLMDHTVNGNSCPSLAVVRLGALPSPPPATGCVVGAAVSRSKHLLALQIASRIGIERTDGTSFHWLTSGASFDSQPVWSPDGKRIAFSREGPPTNAGGTSNAVMTIGADGHGLRRVTRYVAHDDPLGWSPDGLILFERSDPVEDFGIGDLYVIRPDGSGRTKVAESASLGSASWRPR